MKNILTHRPVFYAKRGVWGQYGWGKVQFWSTWLPLWLGDYVVKIEWEKR